MGNSASQPRSGRADGHSTDSPTRRGRSPSPVPLPGQPHSSMRTKKKSLELPGFNRTNLSMTAASTSPRGRQKTPPPTQAINIPKTGTDATPARRPNNNFSSSELIVPATHLPFPPTQAGQRSGSGYETGTGQGGQRSKARPQRMQQIGPVPPPDQVHQHHYQDEPATPPSPAAFQREVVNSSIPIGLLLETDERKSEEEEEEPTVPLRVDDSTLVEPIAVPITWRGGGRDVVLARAGDDDWNGRLPMEREHPSSNTWTATIYLLPGTHHVRFLVDDQWRVSDELPTAVDDQGSLANYVNVQSLTPPSQTSPLPPVTPTPAPQPQTQATPRPPQPGQSFWSTNSSIDDDDDRHHQSSTGKPHGHGHTSSTNTLHFQITQGKWTTTLPYELIEAAREEEAYITASAGHYDANSRSVHVSGFVPAPNIPPAPGLPRHLDKLILNTKMTVPGSNNNTSGGNSNTGSPARGSTGGMAGGIGSGQGGRGDRERERERDRDRGGNGRREGRERDRDRTRRREERREEREREKREREQRREREREQAQQQTPGAGSSTTSWRDSGAYTNMPPAPPNSEDGTGMGLDEKPEQSPVRGDVGGAVDDSTTPAINATTAEGSGGEGELTEGQTTQESANTTAITTPEPPTASPEPPQPKVSIINPSGTMSSPPPTVPRAPPTSSPLSPLASASALASTPISGSRAITLDMENLPSLTDDNSVLPVPSHVVLQHLCTSAIRNEVLAVACTNRYRKKFMTTVLYKPTS
ncbi:SNF1 protein kinase subunit beta-2 [Leucoagaricus sp. SymC.cos]|nr:SNF1 protein kinase subunit beta-2 [Leucoagaricus sp. SymC.cos]